MCRGTLAMFDAYAAVRAKGRHLVPKPGDRLPLHGRRGDRGERERVGSSRGRCAAPARGRRVARRPAPPAQGSDTRTRARRDSACSSAASVSSIVGDLSGAPLFALACPREPRSDRSTSTSSRTTAAPTPPTPATFAAFAPRVAVVNNGANKGGAPETFDALRHAAGVEDVWQLHRSRIDGSQNYADERIANLRRHDGALDQGERERGWVVYGDERPHRRGEVLSSTRP